jgi:hypothetical protein
VRSRSFRIILGILGVFAALVVLSYAFRDALASNLAAAAIDRSSKLHCTKPKIAIATSLDRVELGEIECTMNEGPIRYAHVEGESVVELKFFKPLNVHIENVTIDMRDRDVSHVKADTVGELAKITGLMDILFKGMLDFGQLYSPNAPPVEIDELTMRRAGKQEALLHGFRKTSDGEWDRCQSANVKAPGIATLVTLQGLDMWVKPEQGRMSLNLFLTKPARGAEPDMEIGVLGRQLGGAHPKFSIKL